MRTFFKMNFEEFKNQRKKKQAKERNPAKNFGCSPTEKLRK